MSKREGKLVPSSVLSLHCSQIFVALSGTLDPVADLDAGYMVQVQVLGQVKDSYS